MTQVASNSHRVEIVSAATTALASFAASMSPGWAEFTGFTNSSVLYQGPESGRALGYCGSVPYLPGRKEIHFFGEDHNDGPQHHFAYREATNDFVEMTRTTWGAHGYFSTSADPATEDLYVSHYDSFDVSRVNPATGAYPFSTTWPGVVKQNNQSLAWWPAAGGFTGAGIRGALILCDGQGQLWAYDPVANSWFWSLTGWLPNPNVSTYGQGIQYCPTHNLVIFGGLQGNGAAPRGVWKLTASRTLTRLSDTPFTAGWGVNGYHSCVNPVTGNVLFIGNGEFWDFNPTTDSYTPVAGGYPSGITLNPATDGGGWMSSASLSTYGVTLWIQQASSTPPARIFLNKR